MITESKLYYIVAYIRMFCPITSKRVAYGNIRMAEVIALYAHKIISLRQAICSDVVQNIVCRPKLWAACQGAHRNNTG